MLYNTYLSYTIMLYISYFLAVQQSYTYLIIYIFCTVASMDIKATDIKKYVGIYVYLSSQDYTQVYVKENRKNLGYMGV